MNMLAIILSGWDAYRYEYYRALQEDTESKYNCRKKTSYNAGPCARRPAVTRYVGNVPMPLVIYGMQQPRGKCTPSYGLLSISGHWIPE